ncbi:hypothetical protein ACIBEJ_37045 [Nonomuraea sp. NPDC050790]|uniref:hypothetical protein n=1 Tax=Nonomuraea sp. NPDC050790 TaxID=3364371 RepID=UPI003790B298
MTDIDPVRVIPRKLIIGAVAALVITTAGGAGVATAASASPTPAPSETAAPTETPPPSEAPTAVPPSATAPAEPPKRARLRAMGGIRSEVVVPKAGGGYQTIATHTGEVTAADADSITVKSEDGFSREYAVTDTTRVNAGREGISGVKNGDTVHVTATVEGDSATAQQVTDLTRPEAGPVPLPGHFKTLPGIMPPDFAVKKRLPEGE